MKIKYYLITLIGLAISISATAQKTNLGADYMALGEKELAKEYFMKRMRQSPTDSYYHLGQLAYEAGDMKEAESNFQSALNSNPESWLAKIGVAKIAYQTDAKQATKDLNDIRKKNRKDIPILIEVARAYSDLGETKGMEDALKDARKEDNKSPLIYFFEGQVHQKAGRSGNAAQQYDMAKNFDPEFVISYIKGARLYANINPAVAVELLNDAIKIAPEYSIAYKYLADIHYDKGAYQEAINAYNKLFESGFYTDKELQGYAASQYFSGAYEDATETLKKGLEKNPQNFVLNRLLMYSDNKLEKYEDAEAVAKTFFAIPRDTTKYIPEDHMTYANILIELGKKEAAIDEYKKVLVLDTTKIELYKQVASVCANEGMYEQAGDFLTEYASKKVNEIDPTDFYQSGFYYYRAGAEAVKDSAMADKSDIILEKADTQFKKLIELTPDLAQGYLMRARTNALKDPDTIEGTAKPHYEALIEILKKQTAETGELDEASKPLLVEALGYLSYYQYLQYEGKQTPANKAKAKETVEKLLEIDPTNHIGTQLLPVLQ